MPKPPKRLELSFFAVDDVDVPQLAALYAGRRTAVGKRFDPDEAAYVSSGDAETVVLVGDEIRHHLPHYAAACRQGELRPANVATAKALGVPGPSPSPAGSCAGSALRAFLGETHAKALAETPAKGIARALARTGLAPSTSREPRAFSRRESTPSGATRSETE